MLALALLGCGGAGDVRGDAASPETLRIEAAWRLCEECPARSSEGASSVSCNVSNNGASRRLALEVRGVDGEGRDYGLALSGALVPFGATAPEPSGCVVRVVEGGVAHEGACSGAPPSDDAPCQVSDLVFDADELGRARITGALWCAGAPRDLAAPEGGPVRLVVRECPGHVP